MNPNLVPTPIVNKNGVATTVHKKPLNSPDKSAVLPAPAVTVLPKKNLTEAQRSEMINGVHRWIGTISQDSNPDTGKKHNDIIRDMLFTYPDNAVTAMHEYFMSDMENSVKENHHRSAFIRVLSDPRFKDTGHTVHEYLTFKPVLQRDTSSIIDGLSLVRGLHDYSQLPVMDSYGDADQETQEQIGALITVTQALYNKYKDYQREVLSSATISGNHSWDELPDMLTPLELGIPINTEKKISLIGDDLINLIMEQPENTEAISKVIVQDGINDPALLREIFDSKTPSLRDGLL